MNAPRVSQNGEQKNCRVLLYEEDPVLFAVIRDFMNEAHPEFTIINNDIECMKELGLHKAAAELKADVAVYDLNVVRLDNSATTCALRFLSNRLPLILITPFGADDTCRKARALGAASYLSKPFKIADLCHEIERLAPVSANRRARLAGT